MDAKQKKFYQMGARLCRTGGWNASNVTTYCKENGIVGLARGWLIAGCIDEGLCNPDGKRGRRLGDPKRYVYKRMRREFYEARKKEAARLRGL